MSPLVEPLDVVIAPQEAVPWLQLPTQQVQKVTGKVSPPVVDLTHHDVSGSLETNKDVKEMSGRGMGGGGG